MSRHVSDERLEILHVTVSGALRKVALNDHRRSAKASILVQVDARVLSPLLDELRRRRQTPGIGGFDTGHITKVLMAMKIGESVEIEPTTLGALTSARKTARKRMETPDAVWHTHTQPDGYVRVTRKHDGAARHDPCHNPAIQIMAAMRVGDTRTLSTLKGKMHNGIKIHARKHMDYAGANWRCTNLANGTVRCERTS